MKKEKLFPFLKWAIYYAALLLLYALQTTPKLFAIFDVKPLLVFLPVIAVSMFEEILPAAIYGMVGGLLLDLSQGTIFGFNGIILLVLAAGISALCIYYLHAKFLNALWFAGVAILIQEMLYFLFCYVIWRFNNTHIVLLRHILPSVLYTWILIIPTFFLTKKLSHALKIEEHI